MSFRYAEFKKQLARTQVRGYSHIWSYK